MPIVCVGCSLEGIKLIQKMVESKIWCVEDFYFSEEYSAVVRKYFPMYNSYSSEDFKQMGYNIYAARSIFIMGEVSVLDPIWGVIIPFFHRHISIFSYSSLSNDDLKKIFPKLRIALLGKVDMAWRIEFLQHWTDARKRSALEMFMYLPDPWMEAPLSFRLQVERGWD